MADFKRLLVISNRLPISLSHAGGEWITSRSAGGLATAMDPILKRTGGAWIGWSGAREQVPDDILSKLREEQRAIPVRLAPEHGLRFYEGYANQAVWPLFHSFISRAKFVPENWSSYHDGNERFCDAIVEQYREGDRIWVHDYHLMLLPRMLRRRLPDAAIGFFLHIPFPSSDIFAVLPRGEMLLRGLLGADLVAFHTHSYLQHFRRSLRRLLGVESTLDCVEAAGRRIRIEALPIGIAPESLTSLLETPESKSHVDELRRRYEGSQILLAIDRLDYTKGLPERLRAFERLLRTHPELEGKVVLIQVAVPSRENIESYQELRAEVHELVSHINGKHGTAGWVPVNYIHRSLPPDEVAALYRIADVAWVAPLRDGMNLVAKEYVACKEDGNGVLILSTFTGAAAEMGEALLVNPMDEEDSAEAVFRAINMDAAEKRDRMGALRERVLRNDVYAWGDQFLSRLDEASAARTLPESTGAIPMPAAEFEQAFRTAPERKCRLLLLDYDGTLVPIADRPPDAVPGANIIELLTRLAADPRNRVFVISGRKSEDLERWLGNVPHLGLAPEHSARWRFPGSHEWHGHTAPHEWKQTVRPILQHYVDRTPGSFIEEKGFALVWHYRTADPEFGEWLATELVSMLEGMLADTELRAYRGKKIVEVKPPWANKGAIVPELLAAYPDTGFLCAMGDDRTDEDLFAALPKDAWSIFVGDGVTKAKYRLARPADVSRVLQRLVD